MIQKNLKPITETKYLSAENAWRYRGIMRTFYIFDQKYKHWLHKEDVYQALLEQEAFKGYTIDQVKQDLDSLVEWKNLSAVQDTSKVATYQQFMNKQFRYQMTEYAIEIERMTIRLENIFIEGGSLEPTLLERIKDQLAELKPHCHLDNQQAGAWWSHLSSDFQRLNQNYQDYIREWYSVKADELMKSRSFLLYKEKLVDYLRHFIKELQLYAFEIEHILKNVTKEERSLLVEKIAKYEFDIPRLDLEEVTYQDVFENIQGKMQSLFEFFLSDGSRDSEVETILSMTNEVIRKITRSAANILEASGQFSNRKEEYRLMAGLFHHAPSVEEAHKLAANVFGIAGYKHFQSDHIRETESIQSGIWDEGSAIVLTAPRVRNYRERMFKTGIHDRTEEKREMRAAILLEKTREREALEAYIRSGLVDFKTVGEVAPFVRHALLRWQAKAMQEKDHVSQTEFGVRYRIVNPKTTERCVMMSPDGAFELPAYQMKFEVPNERS